MWKSEELEERNAEVDESVQELFGSTLTGSISIGGETPWAFTAYLAILGNRIWFTSQEVTRHVQAIRANGRVAVCVWRDPLQWGDPLNGMQLEGLATEISSASDSIAGLGALHLKFPGTKETISDSAAVVGSSRKTCLFEVVCTTGSLRDEVRFGKGKNKIHWVD